jgi:hypothetical protein
MNDGTRKVMEIQGGVLFVEEHDMPLREDIVYRQEVWQAKKQQSKPLMRWLYQNRNESS